MEKRMTFDKKKTVCIAIVFFVIFSLLIISLPVRAEIPRKILTTGRATGVYKESSQYLKVSVYSDFDPTRGVLKVYGNIIKTFTYGDEFNVVESYGHDQSQYSFDGLYIEYVHIVTDSVDGWAVWSSDMVYVRPISHSISFEGISLPSSLKYGAGYYVKTGKITSTYPLTNVQVSFENASTGARPSTPPVHNVSVSGTSVNIYPEIDAKIWLASVPVGTWKLKLVATDNTGYQQTWRSPAFSITPVEALSCWATVDRNNIYTGETIHISYGSNKNPGYYLHINRNGNVEVINVSGGTAQYTFSSPGTYSVYVGAAIGSESAYSEWHTITVTDRDTQAPTVISARVENVTSMGYDVVCLATDNFGVASLQIGTWHDNMHVDHALWQSLSGSSGRFHVDVSSFGGAQNVTYHTNVYAVDTSGNWSTAVRAQSEAFVKAGEGDWIVSSSLPAGVTSEYYDIEYQSSYATVSASSPGAGWVQGSLAYQKYESTGSAYVSDMELEESETRKLVSYYWYHYCGKRHGVYADHVVRNGYVHYDTFTDVNSVEPIHRQEDDTDTGYWAYILQWKSTGERVYCNSNSTSDGSNAYYWYRRSTYQDYRLVNYYNWSRTGTWTSQPDGSAASVMVRYKRKQIPVTEVHLSTRLQEMNRSDSSVEIQFSYLPAGAFPVAVTWTSSDETVAVVNNGIVTCLGVGAARITCQIGSAQASCLVVVHADRKLVLPKGMKVIEEDAFRGDLSIEEVVLPGTLERIESGAFAGCTNLKLVIGGSPDMEIAANAFATSEAEHISLPNTAGSSSEPQQPGSGTNPVVEPGGESSGIGTSTQSGGPTAVTVEGSSLLDVIGGYGIE